MPLPRRMPKLYAYFKNKRQDGEIMAGFWHRLVNFFMIEERRAAPPRLRQVDSCSACRNWLPPGRITTREVPSVRAIQWAQDNGYGRCTAKPSKDQQHERGDTKRFTLPTDGCGQFQKSAGTVM